MRTTLLLLAPLLTGALLQEPATEAAPPWRGNFVPAPADALPIEIWPESWTGEWLFLEVAAHGGYVHEGQVIARFESRPLAEALERAERELEAARVDQRAAEARAGLENAAAEEQLATAVAALARGRRNFQGWKEIELPMRREQAALQDLFAVHNLEDAEDELEQLESMYGADELTDATEELVLMRNRRNLARSRTQLDLARRQRAFADEYALTHEDQEKEEAMKRQEAGLERLRASLELDAAGRRERLSRSADELKRKEREVERLRGDQKFVELRAPREGLLLHGGPQDYEPGRAPPRHARGDRAPTRRPVFTLSSGTRYAVVLELGEKDRAKIAPGSTAEVRCPSLADFARTGRLEVESFPLARSVAGGESLYAATVILDAELRGVAPGMKAEVRLVGP